MSKINLIKVILICSFFIFLFNSVCFSLKIDIGGFIFDQTRTRMGREFYDLFVKSWDYPEDMISTNITISEFTDPRFGSQILIYVDDNLIYSAILRPRTEELEMIVNEAVNAIFQYVLSISEQNKALLQELKIFY